jgi:hypothetical protein
MSVFFILYPRCMSESPINMILLVESAAFCDIAKSALSLFCVLKLNEFLVFDQSILDPEKGKALFIE